jgi:hypothetical protein
VLSENFFFTLKKKFFGCRVIFRLTRSAFPEIWEPQLAKLMELQQVDSCAPLNWATSAQRFFFCTQKKQPRRCSHTANVECNRLVYGQLGAPRVRNFSQLSRNCTTRPQVLTPLMLGALKIPQGSNVFGLGTFTSQSFHRVLSITY